jgi:signal transduction histidine kinase
MDHDQLVTVLVNLLLNALDAMPEGGCLGVCLEALPAEARLTISDTGPGIQPDMLRRLFTPFLSNKPTGTGLGLCISKRIVESHGGRIVAANRPEGGACITLTVPTPLSEGTHAQALDH